MPIQPPCHHHKQHCPRLSFHLFHYLWIDSKSIIDYHPSIIYISQGENNLKMLCKLMLVMLKLLLKSRQEIILENLALRQQLIVQQRTIKKPRIKNTDRIFWVWLSRIWNNWKSALIVVKPETVIRWHHKGFKLYWQWKSRRVGRPSINWELIKLIRKLQKENPLWSAQRIQGELAKLGYSVCDNTVAKYMRKPKANPDKRQRWRTFLRNHAKHIVGIDFMVVRTIFFKAVYVFVAISHDRRKILHFSVSSKPHSQWAIQQLREAFGFDETTKYVIRDNDKIFSEEFKQTIRRFGLKDTPTAPQSPWQKDYASYCTSLVLSVVNVFKGFLSGNFVPCILTGFSPAMSS
jgi:putative transposase